MEWKRGKGGGEYQLLKCYNENKSYMVLLVLGHGFNNGLKRALNPGKADNIYRVQYNKYNIMLDKRTGGDLEQVSILFPECPDIGAHHPTKLHGRPHKNQA